MCFCYDVITRYCSRNYATSDTWVKIVGNGTAQKTATDTVFATTVSAHVCPAGVEWRAMSANVPRTIR
jgi:hypothetical protein